jgi:hypothetical protein
MPGMSRKDERPVLSRKLNLLHFKVYVGIGTIFLLLYFGWLLTSFSGWRLFLLAMPGVFLYGVCRFPITRGTGPKSVDAGLMDFMDLAILWFKVSIGVAIIIYFVSRL